MIRLLIFALIFCCAAVRTVAQEAKPLALTCEYKENPLGIDELKPRLSWSFDATIRNYNQHAYQIQVAEAKSEFSNAESLAWNSSVVKSHDNTNIEYNGSPLKPFTRYYWRVRTFDQNNTPSAFSEVSWFETAMLQQGDWKAKWIGDGSRQFERDEDFYQDDRMPLFKRQVNVTKSVKSARLYIAGLGYYEAFFNGRKVGDHVLDPGWTTYSKQVLYTTYDVGSLLNGGNNVVSVMLGNGWYNALPIKLFSRFNIREVQQTGRPCLKAEIHIVYSDNSKEIIVTDEKWKTAPGPVIRNNVYLGEAYDARLEQPDFHSNNTGTAWKDAVIAEGPTGVLSSQMQPPIRVTKVLPAASVKQLKPGVHLVDFGQNFAGVVRIKVKGKAGTEIKLKYGEDVHPDGSLNYLTTVAGQIKEIWNLKGGPGAPKTAWQEDRYILKGKGVEEWSPRFTFHGFRYVEVTGWPGKLEASSIVGLRMHADLQQRGEFACSNELFNNIHNTIQWTFLSNVFSVQSDCPGREKMGYGADIVATANAFIYNYDMANFYAKTVQDFANDQQPDGGITEIAPYTGIADRGYGGHSGPLGWQLAFPYMQEQLYDMYGNKRIIERHYNGFKKQMEFLQSRAVNGLFHWDISDHEALDPRPEAFTAAAFYYHHAVLAAKFAGIVDQTDDSVRFAKLAADIKRNIVRKYYVPNTGRFDNATQSAQLFALWYNLSPDPERSFDVLMDEVKRHNYHVSSGIFGVKMMFDVFRLKGKNEVAYQIANQKDFPGWGYMLSKGATTLWETWEYPDNAPSQNHPMFGSIDEWFYRSLLGINASSPGYSSVVIKPQPVAGLTWAKGSYQSISGVIATSWKITGKRFQLDVSIPGNVTAEVWVPSGSKEQIVANGETVQAERFEAGYAVVKVGSGSYQFESTLTD